MHLTTGPRKPVTGDELLTPGAVSLPLPSSASMAEDELERRTWEGLEYRDERAPDRARKLLASPEALTDFNHLGFGPAAVFARSPQDLPAMLRLADQLDKLAKDKAGERALVWQCSDCGTRYAVPLGLVRRVSIRCERCTRPVDLTPGRSMGEEALLDPLQNAVNANRRSLAEFFREAMARGWPIWVYRQP